MPTPKSSKAVVTDATTPLAQSLCRVLISQGVTVLMPHRAKQPPRVTNMPTDGCLWLLDTDIRQYEGRLKVVRAAWETPGSLDFIFHTVPSLPALNFEELAHAKLMAQLDRQLASPLALIQSLLPQLMVNTPGSVIAIEASHLRTGKPEYAACCAASFGLRGAFEALSREYPRDHLRFITITAPALEGVFLADTASATSATTRKALDAFAHKLLGRVQHPFAAKPPLSQPFSWFSRLQHGRRGDLLKHASP